MRLLLRYARQRIPVRIFAPLVLGIAFAGVWAAGTADASVATRACLLSLLLVLQFRLWDDLEDADADRQRHPDRLLPGAPRAPFRAVAAALACGAVVLAGGTSAVVLMALDAAFLVLYRVRTLWPETAWRYGVLLLKYPAFVAVVALASGSPSTGPLLVALVAAYAGACTYEYWHTTTGHRSPDAAPLKQVAPHNLLGDGASDLRQAAGTPGLLPRCGTPGGLRASRPVGIAGD